MSSLFITPEPELNNQLDGADLADSSAQDLQTSIEVDNDMGMSRSVDSRSPSAMSISSTRASPVTYAPPPPKNDPTGFYTDGKSFLSSNQNTFPLCCRGEDAD